MSGDSDPLDLAAALQDAERLFEARGVLLVEYRCGRRDGTGKPCGKWVARVWDSPQGPIHQSREMRHHEHRDYVIAPNPVVLLWGGPVPPGGNCPKHGHGQFDPDNVLYAAVQAKQREAAHKALPLKVSAFSRRITNRGATS